MMSQTHLVVVVNHAKFDICAPGSFGGVKTDRQNCVLHVYIRLASYTGVTRKGPINIVEINNIGSADQSGFTQWIVVKTL